MFLESQNTRASGEIPLMDPIRRLNKVQRVLAYDFSQTRYDVCEKIGFIKTQVECALQREYLTENVLKYLESVLGKEKVTH